MELGMALWKYLASNWLPVLTPSYSLVTREYIAQSLVTRSLADKL